MAKSRVFLRTPYNYDVVEASDQSGLSCSEPTRAQQHARDECDINTIVRRFGLTGQLPSNVRAPQYGDFLDATDYHSALNAVRAADAAFMELPAHVRTRFNNDAGSFVDFCSDEANRDEAVKLGLIIKGDREYPPGGVSQWKHPADPNPAPEGGGVAQSST